MSQSRENLRTDERTDGQTLFYRTLPVEAVGPKKDHKFFPELFFKKFFTDIFSQNSINTCLLTKRPLKTVKLAPYTNESFQKFHF